MNLTKLSEIFDVSYGTKLDMNKMSESQESKIAFVSRSSRNNGIVAYVDPYQDVDPLQPGLITVTLGGTYVLSSFLQDMPFYTAQNVAVLSSKFDLSKEERLYYCLCISQNRFRYSAFGREANRTLKDIKVPLVKSIPDWITGIDFTTFENAGKKKIDEDNFPPSIIEMTTLGQMFEVKNGIAATGLDETEDKFLDSVMYIRPASTHLRTLRSFISKESVDESSIYPAGTLFVSTNGEGSHTYSYVSTESFVPNSDVAVLIPKSEMPIEIKMYYAKCITANRYLFSYGRKPKGDKLKSIAIPRVTKHNMDEVIKFMQSLKYSAMVF
jgi:Type I restriction modification DNA specificity domain